MDYTTNFAPAAGAAVFPLSPRGTSGERGFYCSASYGFLRMRAQARTWLRQPFRPWPCATNPQGQAVHAVPAQQSENGSKEAGELGWSAAFSCIQPEDASREGRKGRKGRDQKNPVAIRLPHCPLFRDLSLGSLLPSLRVLCGLCVRHLCLDWMVYGFSCGFLH